MSDFKSAFAGKGFGFWDYLSCKLSFKTSHECSRELRKTLREKTAADVLAAAGANLRKLLRRFVREQIEFDLRLSSRGAGGNTIAALGQIEEDQVAGVRARALEDARNGKMFILVDAEDRENEGDLVCAAAAVTPEIINFMATHGRGFVSHALFGSTTERVVRKAPCPVLTIREERDTATG